MLDKAGEERGSLQMKRLFGVGQVLALALGFPVAVVASNAAAKFVRSHWTVYDFPTYWPLSIFWFRPPRLKQVLLAIAVGVLLYLIRIMLSRLGYRLVYVMMAGVVLVLCTNLIQGWVRGFELPIVGVWDPGFEYYHDAIRIHDALDFMLHYEQLQPALLVHSRTHPPGAVLSIYMLLKALGSPALVSITIAVVSACLSCFFLGRLLATAYGANDFPGYITLLYMLIPAVQIYYCASLDALIVSLLLGVLYLCLFARPRMATMLGAALLLWLTSFLTFGFVFVVPVLAGFELLKKRSLRTTVFVLVCLALAYLLMYAVFHYDYLNSFAIASADQNPQGFRLLSEPANYFLTRLEGIAEIIVFLGPFLALLLVRGLRATPRHWSDLRTLSWLGMAALAAMLLGGVFPTGETARACLFIYPFLIFPIAEHLWEVQASQKDQALLLYLTFAQTLLMQTFGTFAW